MAELTKEYLDQNLQNLATKEDLKNLATKEDLKDAGEELARLVNDGFQAQQEFLIEKLDVRDRMAELEKDMVRIKEALHIK
ncbi:MAG TPA: hypothetical protein VF974_00340 [Patescibacteria group bacterium]